MTVRWLLCSLALLSACGESPPPSDAGPDDASAGSLDLRSPPLETVGACEGVAGFEAHTRGDPALEWSALHADVRFFGEHENPFGMDAHLVEALGGAGATPGVVDGSDAAFSTYAQRVPGGCLVGAWPLPAAPPTGRRGVRWLVPGQPVDLGDATHVLVDLRAAPEGPALDTFLEALVAEAVPTSVSLRPLVRSFNGMRDEAYSPLLARTGENTYRSRVEGLSLTYGGAGREVVLGFVVGDRIAPAAARLVVSLRSAGLAVIVGRGITTRIAEMSARSAGTGGMLFRTMMLYDDALIPLPDRFEADLEVATTVAELEESFVALGPLAPVTGAAMRPDLSPLPASTWGVATERHEGARQASLIAIHGAAELFFPYWDVVESDSDARLREAVALMPEPDEDAGLFQTRSLQYWSNALADSHGFTGFTANPVPFPGPIGVLPMLLDVTQTGEPVVRVSDHPDFVPGDVIVSSRGEAARDVMNDYANRTAASASSRDRNSLRGFLGVRAERDYVLRSPDGVERTVIVDGAVLGLPPPPRLTTRVHGPLTDLGHPEIYYADLDGDAVQGRASAIRAGIDAAESVVLDMRGYPGPDSWSVIRHLLFEGSPGPRMIQVHRSILGRQEEPLEQPSPAAPSGYRGEVVMLVTPSTQSQAEHLVLTLQAADRIQVVGRPSAGANGNITSLALPGEVFQSFTGMIIHQPDGSTFHGRGVRVDHPVPIEVEPLAAGIDPELARAVEVLSM